MSATKVIFRKYRNNPKNVIAIFPEEVDSRGKVPCYEHNGQHGEACSLWATRGTNPATPEEYANLKRELESLKPEPYTLEVVKRWPTHLPRIKRA